MIDRECECGSYIYTYVNMKELAECPLCHKCYILKDGEYKEIDKSEFRIIYRKRLINQQKLNK